MYHLRVTLATTKRILLQLLHDPRTIVLMLGAPILLVWLLSWVFENNTHVFDSVAPSMLGVFPFVIMFIVTSVTTLRERTGGTLERLMAMRIGKFDIIVGYAIAFGVFGALQSLLTSTFAIKILDMHTSGPQWFMIMVAVLDTLLGVALGLFVSAFARTEFQAVQFMPALILPQVIICGLFVPLGSLPSALNTVAYCMPLTYAVDALNGVVKNTGITNDMWRDIWVISAFIVGALILSSLTLRRRTN